MLYLTSVISRPSPRVGSRPLFSVNKGHNVISTRRTAPTQLADNGKTKETPAIHAPCGGRNAAMNGEFIEALQQIAKEKDIPLDTLIETVESALATAYKKNYQTNAEIKVRIDSNKAAAAPFKVFFEKTVVEEVQHD